MSNWQKSLIRPTSSIKEALEAIERGSMQIAMVVDEERHLLGTVTDGDIRRGILRGISLDEAIHTVMNSLPTVARSYEDPQTILGIMKLKQLHQIPIVDESGRVVAVNVLDDMLMPQVRPNWVLLMAGGLGSRLAPLADNCPKPLLNVGGKPLLETILEGFIDQGFRQFYMSVNYMAEMVMDHFGDGSKWGVEIRYLHEQRKMGTAGALTLLPEAPEQPLLVMNGDLLTKVNFRQLLELHMEQKAHATMCIREYNFQVPYGVVRIDRQRLVGIDEKPLQKFFVSAGIYVLNPEIIAELPKDTPLNMPGLFESLIERNYRTSVFPIREYWLDIGQIDDFKRANGEYAEVFQ